jgi:hypothetical protein
MTNMQSLDGDGTGLGADDLSSAPGAAASAPGGAETRRLPSLPGGGSILLVGLFLAGIGALYLLSLRNAPAEASGEQRLVEARVESALAELDRQGRPGEAQDAADIVKRFYLDPQSRQIPRDRLRGNPFVFQPPPSARPERPAAQEVNLTPGEAREARQWQQAQAAIKRLRLQSILAGTHGKVAMISNNMLTEGQRIDGWTVVRIDRRQVTLAWKDRTHVLKMPD